MSESSETPPEEFKLISLYATVSDEFSDNIVSGFYDMARSIYAVCESVTVSSQAILLEEDEAEPAKPVIEELSAETWMDIYEIFALEGIYRDEAMRIVDRLMKSGYFFVVRK